MSNGKQLLNNETPKDLNTQKVTYKLFVIVKFYSHQLIPFSVILKSLKTL